MRTKLVAAWNASGIAAGLPVVNEAYPQDPGISFNDRSVPALYLWRTGSAKDDEWLASDYLLTYDTLKLLWVLPIATQDVRVARNPIMQAAHKALLASLERQRDPSWIVATDTDPLAATQGSDIATLAGYWALHIRRWKATTYLPPTPTLGPHDAMEITLELTEQFVDDVTRFDPLGPLMTTLQTADAIPLITNLDLAPAPRTGLSAQ